MQLIRTTTGVDFHAHDRSRHHPGRRLAGGHRPDPGERRPLRARPARTLRQPWLCLWDEPEFTGTRRTHELSTIDIESCVPLPKGSSVQSLANRTGRPVTTYQSAECAETGEFDTYPGGGTWVPRSPYQVRAFKVWEN